MRESLIFQFGGKEFAVQPGDVGDRDPFRTFRFAGAGVGAGPESEFVHLSDHRFGAAGRFDAALRQLGQRRNAGGDEQHRGTVLAGGYAGAATDAGGRVHAFVGIRFRDRARRRY